jgi:hypothetical protein
VFVRIHRPRFDAGEVIGLAAIIGLSIVFAALLSISGEILYSLRKISKRLEVLEDPEAPE